jgi:hypothetical protein
MIASRTAPQLLDQLGVGAAIDRADPHVNAFGGPFAGEVVRPVCARMDVKG